MNVQEFAEQYWWPLKEAKCAPSTLAGYRSDYRNLVLPRWSDVELSDVRAMDIEVWIASMSHGKAMNALAAIRRIMRKAEALDMIVIDPTRKAIEIPPNRVPYVPKVYTLQEVREVLRGFYGHPLEAWLITSLCTGARRCETTALWRSDFNLKEGIVRIDKGLQCVDGEITEWFCKTPKSVRLSYLPRFATQRLRECLPDTALCQEDDGTRMNPDKVARMFRSHCKRAGLPYTAPMNFRHSYVRLAIDAGVPIEVIQQQIGHSDKSKLTSTTYLWSDKSMGKNAGKKLNRLLLE